MAHLDQGAASGVVRVGAGGGHVDVGGAAQCRVRAVGSDDRGGMDAEHRHHPVQGPGPVVRQLRGGEDRDDLEAVQFGGACQHVADQGDAQVHGAEPGAGVRARADVRQVDAAAQQAAWGGGDFHEVAGAGVGDTQHDAEASRGGLLCVGTRAGHSRFVRRMPGGSVVSVPLRQLLVRFVEEQLAVVDPAGAAGGSAHQVGGDGAGHQLLQDGRGGAVRDR